MLTQKELDGCYAIKTDASKSLIDKNKAVESYRNLQKVEQAFKNMKTVLLELRPVYHKSDDRIKSHVIIIFIVINNTGTLQNAISMSPPKCTSNS